MHVCIPIDWQQCILNLKQHVPIEDIARKLHVSKSCLYNLSSGNVTDPQFSIGVALLNMHLDHVGHPQHQRLFKKRL